MSPPFSKKQAIKGKLLGPLFNYGVSGLREDRTLETKTGPTLKRRRTTRTLTQVRGLTREQRKVVGPFGCE